MLSRQKPTLERGPVDQERQVHESRPPTDAFLPIGTRYRQVRDWIRNYVGFEFAWDVCLVLSAAEVPPTSLGGSTRLGWTTWLGRRPTRMDADDLVLDIEAGCNN